MTFGQIDRVILFGGGRLLTSLCELLIEKGFDVSIITSERHLHENIGIRSNKTLCDYASDKNINLLASPDVCRDDKVKNMVSRNTLGISLGAAWIFKKSFIDLFKGRLLNLHGSRLPQNRGGGGFSWRIMRNDRLGFALIHQIDTGVDTGSIVKFREYLYPASCRLPIEYQMISHDQYLDFLAEFIEEVRSETEFHTIEQPEYLSAYWPRLHTDSHAFIDWRWELSEIEQFINSFDDPYPGAITFLNGQQIRLKKCASIVSDGSFHPFQKGIVYKISGGMCFIAAGEGSLIVSAVTNDDGLSLIKKVKIGDRFFTPQQFLEEAMQYRAVYIPSGLKKAALTRELIKEPNG